MLSIFRKIGLSILTVFIYTSISAQTPNFLMDGLYTQEKGGKTMWGFYDNTTKELLTEAVYDTLYFRRLRQENSGYYMAQKEGKWGIYKPDIKNLSTIIPIEFDEVFYDNLGSPPYILVKKNKKTGIYTPEGKILLEPIYDKIQSDGFRFMVYKDDKVGIYAHDGTEEIPICYDDMFPHSMIQRTLLRMDKEWTAYEWVRDDNACSPSEEKRYDGIAYFIDFYLVKKGKKYGVMTAEHESLIPMEYDKIDIFFDDRMRLLLVKQQGKYGLLRVNDDEENTISTELEIAYDSIWVEESTYKIKMTQNGRMDYNVAREPYLDMEYNEVYYYEHLDLFTVKKNGKWGLVNGSKQVRITPQYNKLHVMDIDNFMVQKGKKWGIVSQQNRVKIPIAYDEFEYLPDWQVFFIAKGLKWGLASTRRGVMLAPKYDDIIMLSGSMYIVEQKGKWGIMGVNNRVIAEPIYLYYEFLPRENKIKMSHPDGTLKYFNIR